MTSRRWRAATVAIGAFALSALLSPLAAPAQAATSSPAPTPLSPSGTAPTTPGTAVPLTFGIKPKDFGGQPRGSFKFLIAPGRGSNDAVSVYNLSNQPLVLRLYATDAYTNSQGSFAALTVDQQPKDAGTWIKLLIPQKSALNIPPRSRVDVPFLLTVPAGALPGDHPAAIVVSLRSKTQGQSGTALAVDSRVAAQVDVRVAGAVAPALALENVSATYDGTLNPAAPGQAAVSFRVHNTGNVAQSGQLTVSLKGPFGWGAKSIIADIPVINPGSALDVKVPFAEVWPLFRYDVKVAITPVAQAGDPAGTPVEATTTLTTIPWAALGLFLAIMALSGLISALIRRRRTPPVPRTGGRGNPAAPVPSDDLLGV